MISSYFKAIGVALGIASTPQPGQTQLNASNDTAAFIEYSLKDVDSGECIKRRIKSHRGGLGAMSPILPPNTQFLSVDGSVVIDENGRESFRCSHEYIDMGLFRFYAIMQTHNEFTNRSQFNRDYLQNHESDTPHLIGSKVLVDIKANIGGKSMPIIFDSQN